MRFAALLLAFLSAACADVAPPRIPDPGAGLDALQAAIDRDGILAALGGSALYKSGAGELWTPDPQDLHPLLEARAR